MKKIKLLVTTVYELEMEVEAENVEAAIKIAEEANDAYGLDDGAIVSINFKEADKDDS